jgi:FKBP12-rapamycin complex-associated protein
MHGQPLADRIGFVGHIIGLGDRHGSNILVDQLTWGALHIDFGDVSQPQQRQV